MTMTAEQAAVARLTLELRQLRAAQDRQLQHRSSRISAMLDSLYKELREQGEGLQASCIPEIRQHLSDLDVRIGELLPIDNKVTPSMARRAG